MPGATLVVPLPSRVRAYAALRLLDLLVYSHCRMLQVVRAIIAALATLEHHEAFCCAALFPEAWPVVTCLLLRSRQQVQRTARIGGAGEPPQCQVHQRPVRHHEPRRGLGRKLQTSQQNAAEGAAP